MTIFMDPPRAPRRFTPARGEAGLADIFLAAQEAAILVDNGNAAAIALERAYTARVDAIREATGETLAPDWFHRRAEAMARDSGVPAVAAHLLRDTPAAFEDWLRTVAARHPDHIDVIRPDVPLAEDARELARQAQGEIDRLAGSRDGLGKWGALFSGYIAGGLRDPLNVALMAFGVGPGAATSVAGRIMAVAAKEALINGGVEVVQQPMVQAWRREVGLDHGVGQALANIGVGAAIGGVLGGAVRGGVELFDAGTARLGRARRDAAAAEAAKALVPRMQRLSGQVGAEFGAEWSPAALRAAQEARAVAGAEAIVRALPDPPPRAGGLMDTAAIIEPVTQARIRAPVWEDAPRRAVMRAIEPELVARADARADRRLRLAAREQALSAAIARDEPLYRQAIRMEDVADEQAGLLARLADGTLDEASARSVRRRVRRLRSERGRLRLDPAIVDRLDAQLEEVSNLRRLLADLEAEHAADAPRLERLQRYVDGKGGRVAALEETRALWAALSDAPVPLDVTALGRALEPIRDALPAPVRGAIDAAEAEALARPAPQTAAALAEGEHDMAVAAAVRFAEDPDTNPPPRPAVEPPAAAQLATDEPALDAQAFIFVDPRALTVDARRFQFKAGGDAFGVTDALRGVTRWDRLSAKTIIVWEDAAGRRFVADGHQRTGLARRLMEEGHEPITIPAYLLREADGVTDADARLIAAYVNIRDGRASPIDAAKILRHPNAERFAGSLPPNEALVRDAGGLARLSEDAFTMAVNGLIRPSYAAAVGRLAEDPRRHAQMIDAMIQAGPRSIAEAEGMVRDMLRVPVREGRQVNLFGEEEVARMLLRERARVRSAAVNMIRRDAMVFNTLTREEQRIAAAGNVLETQTNRMRAETDEQILTLIDRLSDRAGPIADALNAAARAVADGQSSRRAAGDYVDVIRRELAQSGGNIGRAGQGEPPARGADAIEAEPPPAAVRPASGEADLDADLISRMGRRDPEQTVFLEDTDAAGREVTRATTLREASEEAGRPDEIADLLSVCRLTPR